MILQATRQQRGHLPGGKRGFRGAEHPNVERKLREFGAILGAVGFSSRLDARWSSENWAWKKGSPNGCLGYNIGDEILPS